MLFGFRIALVMSCVVITCYKPPIHQHSSALECMFSPYTVHHDMQCAHAVI